MIEAYIDDSGSHQGAPVAVAAGYFASRDAWERFSSEWTACLKAEGFAPDAFHATKFVGRRWREGTVLALSRVIAKYRAEIHPVSSAADVPDFHSLSVKQRRFFTGASINGQGDFLTNGVPGEPFFLPFINAVQRMGRRVEDGDSMNCYVGLGTPLSRWAGALWRHLGTIPDVGQRLGDIAFPLHKTTPALQAADLLAYMMYRLTQVRINTGRTLDAASEVERNALAGVLDIEKDITYQDKHDLLGTLRKAPEPFQGLLLDEPADQAAWRRPSERPLGSTQPDRRAPHQRNSATSGR